MNDELFYAVCELVMCADPIPVDRNTEDCIKGHLDQEARNRGYDSWIDYYMEINGVSRKKRAG